MISMNALVHHATMGTARMVSMNIHVHVTEGIRDIIVKVGRKTYFMISMYLFNNQTNAKLMIN